MSDFMISDAALAMRMQEMQEEQSADFAALLDGFDGSESAAVKPGQVNQPKQAQTEDAHSGQAVKEIPGESAEGTAVKAEEAPEKVVVSEEDEDKPAVNNTTTEQMTFAALHAVEIDSEISAEFEEITAALTENTECKEIAPVIPVDGDAEMSLSVQQTVSGETVQAAAEDNAEVPQITVEQNEELVPPELKEILKTVEEADAPEEQAPEKVSDDAAVTETVISGAVTADEEIVSKVKQDTSVKAQIVKTEVGEEQAFAAKAPAEVTAQTAETAERTDVQPTAENEAENNRFGVKAVSEQTTVTAEASAHVNATADAQTEAAKAAADTKTEAVKAEYTQAEDVKALADTQTDAVRAAADTQTESENGGSGSNAESSEKGFEVFRSAVKKGEISAPEVRAVTREVTVKAEQSEDKAEILQPVHIGQSEEQPRAQRMADGKTNSVTEELEMLKNAKAKSNQPAQTQEKPVVSGESPLTANAPFTLTRANGERVEVNPDEIIRQAAAKLVETAQTMKEQATEYSMVLNPEELGRIVVKLVKAADGAVSVSITAENSRTQRILEQHSAAMQENLRDSGVKLEGWQMVRESEQETYAQDYNGSSKNPYYREEDHTHGEQQEGEQTTSFADLIASM